MLCASTGIVLLSCAQALPTSEKEVEQNAAVLLMVNTNQAIAASSGRCNGQGFCYIFGTSGAWVGDLGGSPGISGADSRCMNDSNKPNSGTYKAMVVDGATRIASTTANAGDGQVDWVLHATTEYRRPDGLIVMTSDANRIFVFGALTTSIATGTFNTGLNADWTTGTHCTGWTDNTAGGQRRFGNGSATAATAISQAQTGCNGATRGLYCAQQ